MGAGPSSLQRLDFSEVARCRIVLLTVPGVIRSILGLLFLTHAKTMLPKTRFFYARQAGRSVMSLKLSEIKSEKLS